MFTRRLSIAGSLSAIVAIASPAKADEAYIRVVDVGNAMCVVARIPGGHFLLYDAGNYNTDECQNAVTEIVGTDRLDLVVLSHSDADHVGELPAILSQQRPVTRVVYTGHPGTAPQTWPRVITALERAKRGGTRIRNLGRMPLPNVRDPAPGRRRSAPYRIRLGEATVTFVAGWHRWPYEGDDQFQPDASERRNAISIVVKLEYGGHSVLLTGDTIGRRRNRDADPLCRDAEQWMVMRGNVRLDSDVIVGQHHGGDNSSCGLFIDRVSPTYVVFPAGHSTHSHPRASAAERFLRRGVSPSNIFRTDRGDDDPGDDEWSEGLEHRCVDPAGDDDVEIFLPDRRIEPLRIRYRQARVPCRL